MTEPVSILGQSKGLPRDEALESSSSGYDDQSAYSLFTSTASTISSPDHDSSSETSVGRGRSLKTKCTGGSCGQHEDSSESQDPKLKARREHEPSPSLDRDSGFLCQPEPRNAASGSFELETDDVQNPSTDYGSRVNTSYLFPSQRDWSSYTRPNPSHQAGWGSQPGNNAPYTPAPAHQNYPGQEYQLPPSPLRSTNTSPVHAYHPAPLSPPASPTISYYGLPQPFPNPQPQYSPPHPFINNFHVQLHQGSPLKRSFTSRPTSPLFHQSHIGTINGQPHPPSVLPTNPIGQVHSETVEFCADDRPCDLRARTHSPNYASVPRNPGHGESKSKPGQARSILKTASQQQSQKHTKKQEAKQESQYHNTHVKNTSSKSNQRRQSRHPPSHEFHAPGVQKPHPAHESRAASHLTDFQKYITYVIDDGKRQNPEWGLAKAAMNLVMNYKLGDDAERAAITSAWRKRKYTSVAEKGLAMLKGMGWYAG